MAGTVIENLSGRKLAVLCAIMLVFLAGCFMIGGLKSPAPSNSLPVLGVACLEADSNAVESADGDGSKWLQLWSIPDQSAGCRPRTIDELWTSAENGSQVVFVFQLPLRKDGRLLDFSRWQQNLIGVLQADIERGGAQEGEEEIPPPRPGAMITLDMRLGYKNKHDKSSGWRLLASSVEQRPLDCSLDEHDENSYSYDCQLIPLFELGSLHHDYYLLNIRLPTDSPAVVNTSNDAGDGAAPIVARNTNIGKLSDLQLVAIHSNGGFTKIWLSLKIVFFPLLVVLAAWFWRRVQMLSRPAALLERMVLALAIALSILNVPLELLSLSFDAPWLLLVADVRQGVFYAMLLSFWLVFTGEHLIIAPAEPAGNRLRRYWRHLSAVVIGCSALFVFDVCERGAQLVNPFYSIWGTTAGRRLALAFIITAGVCAGLYFCFLCWMVWRVFVNISVKRQTLPSMSSVRRLHYEGIIYRFKFLMLATVVCAAMTVIGFVLGQVAEGQWKWDDNIELQYTSAVMCGVYGMWNVYTMLIVSLYAPSHKRWPQNLCSSSTANVAAAAAVVSGSLDSQPEEIEFSRLTRPQQYAAAAGAGGLEEPSDMSSLTQFARKVATD